MLKKGFKTKNKTVYETFILAKYLFYIGLEENKIKEKIINFYIKFQKDFTLAEYYKVINRTINYAKNSKLKTGVEVYITKSELDVIQELEDLREQKLAFVMLVLYKFNNCNKFTVSLEDLFTMSELTTIDSKTRLKLLHSLTSKGYIDINTRGKRWVKFSDKKRNDYLIIRNFDNFIFEYLILIKSNEYKRCVICNKAIKSLNNNMKYCKLCSYKKRLERQRTYMKK